jgi:hypothetical protein
MTTKAQRRIKCGYADRYQATREPTCGCNACAAKWLKRIAIHESESDTP